MNESPVSTIGRRWALLVLAALGVGCGQPVDSDAAVERAPLGKADALAGTCESADANACGGPSDDGVCWCDDECEAFGDCCADKSTVCDEDLLSCDELDLQDPADDAQCLARPDCAPFLVADCPVCAGGSLVCIEILPATCEELDTSDPQQRDQCESRPDCALFIEPACPVCPGGAEVCTTVQ